MGFVLSFSMVKSIIDNRGNTCMFLGYAQNRTGGIYRMLNLHSIHIIIIRDDIQMNKTYREYVSRKENNSTNHYLLQDEDESND